MVPAWDQTRHTTLAANGIIGEKKSAERRMMETLTLWLQYAPTTASWKEVVIALQEMEENTVAERIHSKYIGGASR